MEVSLPFFYTPLMYNSYTQGRLPIRMEAFLFSVQPLYTTHIEKADFISEWRLPKKREWYGHGHPSLSPTRLGRRCLIFPPLPNSEKGSWPLCLPYTALHTTHIEKADSLSEWLELVLGVRLRLGLGLGCSWVWAGSGAGLGLCLGVGWWAQLGWGWG